MINNTGGHRAKATRLHFAADEFEQTLPPPLLLLVCFRCSRIHVFACGACWASSRGTVFVVVVLLVSLADVARSSDLRTLL